MIAPTPDPRAVSETLAPCATVAAPKMLPLTVTPVSTPVVNEVSPVPEVGAVFANARTDGVDWAGTRRMTDEPLPPALPAGPSAVGSGTTFTDTRVEPVAPASVAVTSKRSVVWAETLGVTSVAVGPVDG